MYQTRHITPYVHAFANHVPEFLKLHGSLYQQGLENLNDLETKEYLTTIPRIFKLLNSYCQRKIEENTLKYMLTLVVRFSAQIAKLLVINVLHAFADAITLNEDKLALQDRPYCISTMSKTQFLRIIINKEGIDYCGVCIKYTFMCICTETAPFCTMFMYNYRSVHISAYALIIKQHSTVFTLLHQNTKSITCNCNIYVHTTIIT